jgi:hypothetical protein
VHAAAAALTGGLIALLCLVIGDDLNRMADTFTAMEVQA